MPNAIETNKIFRLKIIAQLLLSLPNLELGGTIGFRQKNELKKINVRSPEYALASLAATADSGYSQPYLTLLLSMPLIKVVTCALRVRYLYP